MVALAPHSAAHAEQFVVVPAATRFGGVPAIGWTRVAMVLRALQGRRFAMFEDLFDPSRGPQVLVVTFIALLELAREHLLEVTQAEAFAPIYVRLAYTPS